MPFLKQFIHVGVANHMSKISRQINLNYLPNCSMERTAAGERYPVGVLRLRVTSEVFRKSLMTFSISVPSSESIAAIPKLLPWGEFTSGEATSLNIPRALTSHELIFSLTTSAQTQNSRSIEKTQKNHSSRASIPIKTLIYISRTIAILEANLYLASTRRRRIELRYSIDGNETSTDNREWS